MSNTLVNANALFQGLKTEPSFHKKIAIRAGDKEDKILRTAQQKLRTAIRAQFNRFLDVLQDADTSQLLFEERGSAFRKAVISNPITKVRFLTQGSHAYELLIRPARKGQEIDLDDGVYFPMPFIDGTPAVASKGLFDLVERAIAPLVRREGWSFKRMDTCLRVLIGNGAHIDLPLYAIEDGEFQRVRKILEDASIHDADNWKGLDMMTASAFGRQIAIDKILLAHRTEDWVASDPKQFADWFDHQLDIYGPVLRRLIRYFKAWRDLRWQDGKLKSMAIMILCVAALNDLGERPGDERDDVLVLEVVQRLPAMLQRGNITWHPDEPPLDERWTVDERDEIVAAANGLRREIESALLETGHAKIAVDHLRGGFGARFPNAPDSIQIARDAKIDAYRAAPAIRVSQPDVGTNVSG